MAGLLDIFDTIGGQQALGLLAAAGPRSDGAGFGQRLQEGLGAADQWKRRKAQDEFQQMQMADHLARIEDAKAQRAQQAKMQGLAQQFAKPGIGMAADGYGPSIPASFDRQGYGAALESIDPIAGMQYMQSIKKQSPKLTAYKPGDSVRDDTGREVFSVPKESTDPSAIKEYEYSKNQGYKGSYLDFQLAQKKAGANNVSLKVDNKMGESLAGQVGPMAKDSRIQTQGAVKMFDAANRLEQALDSNKVTSGPLATQIQTAKQLIQVVGGGNDDGIRQTRQAIKSLAQMAVEARKQLQGQGQVTESEAAAVAKADAGDLNDLTTGELRDLATLTKRAAHYQAKTHTDLLNNLGGKPETQGLVPFYGVQGLDPLLKHSPSLPQIGGGGWSIKPVGK